MIPCVRMDKDGQSYHTHHHSALTAPTNKNKTLNRLDEIREDGKLNKVVTHGFSPP